jgi:hypothetical protein
VFEGWFGSRLCENAWLTTLQKLKSQHPFSAR